MRTRSMMTGLGVLVLLGVVAVGTGIGWHYRCAAEAESLVLGARLHSVGGEVTELLAIAGEHSATVGEFTQTYASHFAGDRFVWITKHVPGEWPHVWRVAFLHSNGEMANRGFMFEVDLRSKIVRRHRPQQRTQL